jgi:uncharacterized protein
MRSVAELTEDNKFLASLPPLVRAAATGDEAEVRSLLASGVSPNESDDGWSALHAASVRGQARVVVVLLEAGADVDGCDESGVTALWNAAGPSPSLEVISVLLDAGANPNATDSRMGWTPLSRAVEYDNYETVRLLLSAGADAAVVTADGWTLLMDAAECGSVPIARALTVAGANVSAVCDGRTAADIARNRGHTTMVDLLTNPMGR